MNDIKKNIRRMFGLFCALFAVLALYLCNLFLFGGEAIAGSAFNPRQKMADEGISRGLITDRAGAVLADNEDKLRIYPYGRRFAHIVGSIHMGRIGAENKYNLLLQRPSNEILQRIESLSEGSVSGDTAVLTLNAKLQELAYTALGENKGAAVVIEPSTGKILALVSKPDFDPSGVDWERLRDDTDNSPLLNRATQGLYPPGSIFKLLTATAGLRNAKMDFTFECTGETEIDGVRIRCYNSKAHGSVDMTGAFAASCNGYFAVLAHEMGPGALRAVCDGAYFGRELEYPIERGQSSFVLPDDASTALIMQTAIGQGQTLVTPLHMAMLASAVANDGLMMKPYVLEKQLSASGGVKRITMPEALGRVFSYEEAELLNAMMTETVLSGTAAPAKTDAVRLSAKTGTAENAAGDDHGWVIAFAEHEDTQIAIAVVMENSGGPRKGLELVKKLAEGINL